MAPVIPQNDPANVAKQTGVWQVGYQATAATLLGFFSATGPTHRQAPVGAASSYFRQLTFADYWSEQKVPLISRDVGEIPAIEKQHVQSRNQLAQIRLLQRGWDTYDAEPPTPKSCDIASRVMTALQIQQMPLKFIVPTSDGSILLKHRAGQASATWEIDGDGEIGVMIERFDSEPEFLSIESSDIDATVAKLAWNG